MLGIKAIAVATLVLATLMVGIQQAGASSPAPAPPRPYLSTSYATVQLSRFVTSSITCGQLLAENGQRYGGCQIADGTPPGHPRLEQRLKAEFRGTATLTVPENTDSVVIGYGRQPSVEYSTRPTVNWPVPGSGTYYMGITLTWHDQFTTSRVSYAVPLYVPRS